MSAHLSRYSPHQRQVCGKIQLHAHGGPRICDFSLQSIYAIKSAPLCMIGILSLIIKKTRRFTIVPGKSAEITAARFRRGRNATEREQAPGFCVGTRRGAAVRDGKRAVRGGEAMAAKRTNRTGRFARRNAAPDFAQKPSKPVRPARCPHGLVTPAGVHRMFLCPPLGLPFSSWRQLRTKIAPSPPRPEAAGWLMPFSKGPIGSSSTRAASGSST